MRKSARKLGNHGQGHGTLREEGVVEAVEAVEVEVATEVVQAVGLVLKGSVLLEQYSKKQQLWSDDGQWCLENALQ